MYYTENEIEKKKKLVEYINSMGGDELIELHNSYCKAAGHEDNRIYSVHKLDELLEGKSPTDILCMSFYGDFSPLHDFFWFNEYGNLKSANYILELPIFAKDIAGFILSKGDSLGNDKIQDILDGEDEDNE